VTTTAAYIEEFHTSLRRSLLRLEEHCVLRLALGASLVRPRKGWIRSNVLSHASGLTDGVVENVSEHTGGGGFFGVLAGSAGEVEAVGFGVFFWIQHVGTFTAEAEGDLFHLLGIIAGAGRGGGHDGGLFDLTSSWF